MSEKYSIKQYIRNQIKVYRLCSLRSPTCPDEDGATSSYGEGDVAWAEVVPELGNNCWAFHAQESILEQISFEQFLQRPTSYGIPILFPFPNRIRDGKFCFRGRCYMVNPNRHGFVRDKRWNVDATGASIQEGAWIKSSLDAKQYPEEILKQFPFPFRIEVIYRLKEGGLEMDTMVQNTGEGEMPLGFGIHPYFRLPEQGSIQVPAQKRWELVDYLPTGKPLNVEGIFDLCQPTDLSKLVLDDVFTELIADEDGFVRCILNDEQKHIRTIIEFETTKFRNVVVYTPPAPRQAICIEPYSCPTDAFNLHNSGIESHLIILKPGDMVHFKVRIYVQGY